MRQLRSSGDWRDRAEEARVLAAQLTDAVAKVTMLQIAEGYERMAQRAEAADTLSPDGPELPVI